MKKFELIEIFYSVQGEGQLQGRPAVFIRLSRCDMHCHFCDTPYKEINMELTAPEIRQKVDELIQGADHRPFIVLTGGEPCLQLKDEQASLELQEALEVFEVAIETTGMHKVPEWIDWVTVSPKVWPLPKLNIHRANEIKFLMFSSGEFTCGNKSEIIEIIKELCNSTYMFVQPVTDVHGRENKTKLAEQEVLNFVKAHPQFNYGNRLQNQLGVK